MLIWDVCVCMNPVVFVMSSFSSLFYKPHSLKGLFTNFEYITFFSSPNKGHIFCKRSISMKQLWLEIIEKIGCSKSVRSGTVIYIVYITRTDFVHPIFSIISSQSCFIEINLSSKMFLSVGHEKRCYIFKIGEQSL